jgi:pimeloyl-ACP methyl ester carboxylesterase
MNHPQVLLVHGAFHGDWCWSPLRTELEAKGVATEAVHLPFTTFADDVVAVRQVTEGMTAAGPVMVVGHSFGGLVISAACQDTTRSSVAHLVYLAALLQAPGEAIDLGETPGSAAIQMEGGELSIDPELATTAFYHHCSPQTAEWATERLRPMPLTAVTPESPTGALPSIPTTYIVCTDDQIINPNRQRQMAKLAGNTIEIDSDHSPFLSVPHELAEVLAGIARTA